MPPGFTAWTDWVIKAIPHLVRPRRADDAVDVIIDTIERHPGIELVTLGPLTNIAQALARKPDIAGGVSRCVVMGGAPCCVGNVTPAAEYNFWTDPEAARIVMRSELPVEMIGWQLCRGDAVLKRAATFRRSWRLDTDVARFAIDCNSRARRAYFEQTGEDGISLPDPVAMSIALDPTIGTSWSRHYVDIEIGERIDSGDERRRPIGCGVEFPQQEDLGGICGSGTSDQRLLDFRYSTLERMSSQQPEGCCTRAPPAIVRRVPTYRSRTTTHGRNMAGARSLWRATGMKDGDFDKPIIAIANSFTQFVPGHVHLRNLGALVAEQIERAGGVAKEFNTIAVDDGIAMGHDGMLYSLPSRELIADSVEYMVNAHCADAIVCISNCDKITPGMLMASCV